MMLSKTKNKITVIISFFYLFSTRIVLAQPAELGNPLKNINSIGGLLNAILDFIVAAGSPVIVIAIIYTGFKFVAAQGNSTKIEDAKKMLWWVLVGALIILGARVLSSVISGTVDKL